MSQTRKVLELGGRKITLVGTAHVSKESIEEVESTIRELNPDCVAIELDEKRAESIRNPEKFRQLDIIKILRNHEGFLMMANLILSSFQRRMGQNVGVRPGDEMLAAMRVADEMGIPSVMVDRPIQTTLRRAWAKNSFWGKMKLLASLFTSAFSKEEVSPDEIEKLKTDSEMDSMMSELSEYMPVIKKVLIDERDTYLAAGIWAAKGSNVVAVLGAGHLPGVVAHLEKMAAAEESADVSEISVVPARGIAGKILGWIIPAAIIALIVSGFIYGGRQLGQKMIFEWIAYNSGLAAIFSLIALAHPLTILAAFIAAPITSLCPFIGVGFVTGIVQAFFKKPKVSDMETLQDDVSSLRGWYKNRILRVFLVFILSSIGSSIGSFVAAGGFISDLV
ncbi:MAG: TraB/GumN family protein [Treponema sp.]|nr:TraB/GumN family protein [Treponema sp.]